jgi:glycosyltransferase involved in cell wall biosynthesis
LFFSLYPYTVVLPPTFSIRNSIIGTERKESATAMNIFGFPIDNGFKNKVFAYIKTLKIRQNLIYKAYIYVFFLLFIAETPLLLSTMKNVLVIAYYFPPSGGPGVQRVLKHIQYLPEFGWNPIVLTVANGDFPARDESLLAKIPRGVQVERTEIYEPYALYRKLTGKADNTPIDVNVIKKENDGSRSLREKLAEFVRATFFIPDARIGWLPTALGTGMRLIREHSIEAIYNSSPPYTTALIARQLKRKSGLRWVTGFRDPWTEFLTTPRRWFAPAWIDKRLERSVFEESDAVECAWEGIVKDIRGKFPHLPAEKFHHIPNGFDSSDYPDFAPSSEERRKRFTITYTGSLYGRRNPSSFFAALRSLIERGALRPEEFTARFIGRFGAEVQAMFDEFPYKESLEVLGYMPHEESIAYLLRSDALLLIVDEAKESEEIVPGKVYEYIGALRPIIAIAPDESAVSALLRETSSGASAHQSNVEGIAVIIEERLRAWREGKLFTPNTVAIERYERKNATRRLAALLAGT